MANRYWVGGTATWDGTAGSKWATTSGGAGGAAVPTSADDVFFDANSGTGTITTSGSRDCRSFTCTGFTGTWAGTATPVLSIGDASGGAFVLGSGMTVAFAGTVTLFSSSTNGGAGWTFNTNGKTLPGALYINGSGGKWVLGGAMTVMGNITHDRGTFDTAGFAVNANLYNANQTTQARTLTLASSIVTLGSITAPWNVNPTGFTMTANTGTVICTGANNNFATQSSFDYNGLSVQQNATGTCVLGGSGTITLANYTRTGGAAYSALSMQVDLTLTNAITLNGNSNTNRLHLQSAVFGTLRTITMANAWQTVTATYLNVEDIAASGNADWNLAAITGNSGDCGGNSGITFTTPATQTWQGTTGGSWSNAAKWTSRVPLPQDDVIVNAAFSASQTITADMPRSGKNVDFTGVAGSPALTVSTTANWGVSGSLTLAAGLGTVTLTGAIYIRAHGNVSAFTGGKTLNGVFGIYTTGTCDLGDAVTCTGQFQMLAGILNTNSYSITCLLFNGYALLTNVGVSLELGSSTVTITDTASSGLFFIAGTLIHGANATIVIATAWAANRDFGGFSTTVAGSTLPKLVYTVGDSPGSLTIITSTGYGMDFGGMEIGPGHKIIIDSESDISVATGRLNANGETRDYVHLAATGAYLSIPDSSALDITGDIDLRVDLLLDNWANGVERHICGKWTGSNQSYFLNVATDGKLTLYWSTTGSNALSATSTVATGFAARARRWIRATIDVNDGSGNRIVKFYTSTDGTNWTQLGSTITTAGTTSVFSGSSEFTIGALGGGGGTVPVGYYYRTVLRNGYDGAGSTVLDVDLSTQATGQNTFSESSTNAATVTLNGTAQVGDGRVEIVSSTPGTRAHLDIAGAVASYVRLTDIDSDDLGGVNYAANSADGGNNLGWIFTVPPTRGFGLPIGANIPPAGAVSYGGET